MKPCIGVDLVEVPRIARLLAHHGARFVDRAFTRREAHDCARRKHPAQHFAGRFAAKEAVLKAIGTGFGVGAALAEVELVRDPSGGVTVTLHGKARARARRLGLREIAVSISHTDSLAVAVALGLPGKRPRRPKPRRLPSR